MKGLQFAAFGRSAAILILLTALTVPTWGVSITVGTTDYAIPPGNTASVPLTLDKEGGDVGGLQAAVTYDPAALLNGRALSVASSGLDVYSNTLVDSGVGQLRVIAYGDPTAQLPDDVVAMIVFDVAKTAAAGNYPLTVINESTSSIVGKSPAQTRYSVEDGSVSGALPYADGYIPVGSLSTQWFFAEGDATAGFATYILLVNPSDTNSAEVTLRSYTEAGTEVVQTLTMNPNTRQTLNMGSNASLAGTRFGTTIQVTNDVPIYAERSMYLSQITNRDSGGTDTIGSRVLKSSWFLAEGSTRTGYRITNILMLNPSTTSNAYVNVSFLLTNGQAPIEHSITIPPMTRYTLNVGTDVTGMESQDFSTQIETYATDGDSSLPGAPIVVERTMFDVADGEANKTAATSLGVTELQDTWLFAEGAVHNTFETFLLIANPNSTAVTVDVRYLTSDRGEITDTVTVDANARYTIQVHNNAQMAGCSGFGTELIARNGMGISCERVMYFVSSTYTDRSVATAAVGFNDVGANWYLPEGACGGSSNFENFIVLSNPGDTDAVCKVRFLRPAGSVPQVLTPHLDSSSAVSVDPADNPEYEDTLVTVPAGARVTVNVNSSLILWSAVAGLESLNPALGTQSLSTAVEVQSGSNIVAERAMYWSAYRSAYGVTVPRVEGHTSRALDI
ncbi:hypothetical protein JXA32_08215 [Candidatus Sumerlaeota bacterium]|nr:hypothetical protein [Candidatus Sumerlaeota bacterium]